MIRGVVLIVIAVLLGVVLLNATDEPFTTDDGTTAIGGDDDATDAPDDDEEPDDGAVTTTPSTTPSTTPAAAARPPAEVTVLVANGSGVAGAAATFSEQVGASGYVTAAPANTRGGELVEASVVFYTEGYEAEAAALAGTLSPVPAIAPLPEPAPVDDLRGAAVVLILGPDLATG